jgi:hypothetical protein
MAGSRNEAPRWGFIAQVALLQPARFFSPTQRRQVQQRVSRFRQLSHHLSSAIVADGTLPLGNKVPVETVRRL